MNRVKRVIADFLATIDSKEFSKSWNLFVPLALIVIYMALFPTLASFGKRAEGVMRIIVSPQAFFLLTLFTSALLLKIRPADLGLSRKGLGANIRTGLLLSLVPFGLVVILLAPILVYQLATGAKVNILTGFARGRMIGDNIYLFQLLIMSPVAEELFFRGFLIPPLRRYSKGVGVILISSLVFMLAHGYLKVGAFLLGLFTATVYLRTSSVIPAMIFHLTSNLWGPLLIYLLPEVYRKIYFLFK